MKKLLLSWWWLGMLPAFNLWAVPGAVRLDPATATVALNTAFGLKMLVDSGTTEKVGTYQVKLSYDVSKIKPDDSNNSSTTGCVSCVTAGIILNNIANIGSAGNTQCPAGNLCINGFDGPGKGPGTALHLITANFKCLGVAGSFPIGFTVQALTNEGGITIGTPTATGSTITCGSAPDFIITSIQVPKAGTPAAVVGGTFTAAIIVKNQGTAAGDGKTLSVWNHSIAVPACSAAGWSKQAAVGILAAGASTTITVAGIPADTIAGMRLLRAVVDSTCATAETIETNNQMTLAYPVTKTPGADLAITGITLSPIASTVNGTFTATIAVKNLSTTNASVAGTLSVWNHRPDVAYCSATGASKQVAVPVIAVGVTQSIVVPGIPAGAIIGMRRLRAYVDSGCATPESNELNNQNIAAYAVNAPAPAADFSITAITLNPVSPTVNTAFNATIVIKNNSATTAGDGRFLDVWSNSPGLPQYCGVIGNKRIAVGNIPANTTVTKTITGLVAAAGTTGTRSLRAYVDSACGTNETNEGNNQLVKTY